MSDLTTFASHVQEVVDDAFRIRRWEPGEAHKYMAKVGQRRAKWEALARHLCQDVVRPRLTTVAMLFPNATMSDEQPPHSVTCLFEYCDRFPALATIEFSVEHDVRFENVVLHTRTRLMPVFVLFNEQDNLPLPLDGVDDEEVADWVEERLLEFIDTYLRIDAVGGTLGELSAIDPVCGMQVLQSASVATGSYCGHPYFFCSEDCLAEFEKDPTDYVQVKTM